MEENTNGDLINADYFLWLSNFTQNCGGSFLNNEWDNSLDEINDFDLRNMKKISLLFEVINRYADDHLVPYLSYDDGYGYLVKYNDIGLEIGLIITGKSSSIMCRIVSPEIHAVSGYTCLYRYIIVLD